MGVVEFEKNCSSVDHCSVLCRVRYYEAEGEDSGGHSV